MALRDDSWLSLTPEPERLLPEARAVLRSGQAPPPRALLEAERTAAERIVVAGRKARWDAWLRESAALAARAAGAADRTADAAARPPDSSGLTADAAARPADSSGLTAAASDPAAASAALVRDVVANHDALALGLSGGRGER